MSNITNWFMSQQGGGNIPVPGKIDVNISYRASYTDLYMTTVYVTSSIPVDTFLTIRGACWYNNSTKWEDYTSHIYIFENEKESSGIRFDVSKQLRNFKILGVDPAESETQKYIF